MPIGKSQERQAFLIQTCGKVEQRAAQTLKDSEAYAGTSLLALALDHLTLGRAALYRSILNNSTVHVAQGAIALVRQRLTAALDGLRRAGVQEFIVQGLLSYAWLHFLERDSAPTEHLKKDCERRAQADLDEAWDIAERGPMRLHLADIHLHRARLFFREKPYPWKSPQDDLAAAEKLIPDCGYHRHDQELADAKQAILS